MAFALRFQREWASGVCVAVSLPEAPEAAPLPPELHPDEAAYAQTLAPARRATFVGGRVALRAALAALGARDVGAILSTPRGAPALPAGFVGSLSHKDEVALAIAARADDPPRATVGIDVEVPRPFRADISDRVLTPAERSVVAALDPAARAAELMFRFAAKEAIYKALDPWVRRFVAFHEVEIATTADGGRVATLALARGEGPFAVTLRDASADGLVIAEAWIARGA
jgi:4'-phosphopantetheinyl transferase EntD